MGLSKILTWNESWIFLYNTHSNGLWLVQLPAMFRAHVLVITGTGGLPLQLDASEAGKLHYGSNVVTSLDTADEDAPATTHRRNPPTSQALSHGHSASQSACRMQFWYSAARRKHAETGRQRRMPGIGSNAQRAAGGRQCARPGRLDHPVSWQSRSARLQPSNGWARLERQRFPVQPQPQPASIPVCKSTEKRLTLKRPTCFLVPLQPGTYTEIQSQTERYTDTGKYTQWQRMTMHKEMNKVKEEKH